jgi:hypothetical protein
VFLQAKLRGIADPRTLVIVWKYLNFKRISFSSVDDLDNAPEGSISPDIILVSDQKLKELKNYIIRVKKNEKYINYIQIVVYISRRIILVELIGKYIKERNIKIIILIKKQKKQLFQLSLKNQFINLFFPKTIKYKNKQLSKKTKSI